MGLDYTLTPWSREPGLELSRPGTQLSYMYDVAHGAGLAVVTIAWIAMLRLENLKLAQFACRIMDVQPIFDDPLAVANEGIRRLAAFSKKLACLLPLKNGLSAEDIPTLAKTVKRLPSGKVGNYVPVDEDIINIYELSYK